MLSCETITRDVNRVMRSVSKSLPDQPNITSNSFRVGYISQLDQTCSNKGLGFDLRPSAEVEEWSSV